jgi:hypothetical protein
MSIHSETYQIPSTTSVNTEAQKWEELSEYNPQDKIDGMEFEAVWGKRESEYASEEDASPEAIKRIKALKIGGRLTRITQLMNRSEKAA